MSAGTKGGDEGPHLGGGTLPKSPSSPSCQFVLKISAAVIKRLVMKGSLFADAENSSCPEYRCALINEQSRNFSAKYRLRLLCRWWDEGVPFGMSERSMWWRKNGRCGAGAGRGGIPSLAIRKIRPAPCGSGLSPLQGKGTE